MTVLCSGSNLGSGFCCWFGWTQPSLNTHPVTHGHVHWASSPWGGSEVYTAFLLSSD